MKGQRIVIERHDRHRVECDGERHWYVDEQSEVTGMSPQPDMDIGPCLEPLAYARVAKIRVVKLP